MSSARRKRADSDLMESVSAAPLTVGGSAAPAPNALFDGVKISAAGQRSNTAASAFRQRFVVVWSIVLLSALITLFLLKREWLVWLSAPTNAVAALAVLAAVAASAMLVLLAVASRFSFLSKSVAALMNAMNDVDFHHRKPHRIILVRHGESEGNIDGDAYAHTPDNRIALTERGHQQAADAGARLAALIGDETVTFYHSPFLRTRQTAEHIGRAFVPDRVVDIREDSRLREQEHGNLQLGGEAAMALIKRERRVVGSFYFRFPNGESGADVFDRASGFIQSLFRSFENHWRAPPQNIVIVTHGLFMRLFLMRYYRHTVDWFHQTWNPENCDFFVMDATEGSGQKQFKDYVLEKGPRLGPA